MSINLNRLSYLSQQDNNSKIKEWADELHRELREFSSEKDTSSYFNFDSLLINCVPRTQIDYEHLLAGIRYAKPDYKPNYLVHEDGEKFYRHSIYIRTVNILCIRRDFKKQLLIL